MKLWGCGLCVTLIALGLVLGTRAAAQQGQATCTGWTGTGDIDGGATVNHTCSGDIHVQGKIDGASNVTLTSTNGSITIDGKIDGGSIARLNAAGDIRIGVVGGDGDKKIDGGSNVTAVSGGTITLGNKIDGCATGFGVGGCTYVAFRAANGIDIGNKIDGGVHVSLCTTNGNIHIHDKIDNSQTWVYYWVPSGQLNVDGNQQGGSHVISDQQHACTGY